MARRKSCQPPALQDRARRRASGRSPRRPATRRATSRRPGAAPDPSVVIHHRHGAPLRRGPRAARPGRPRAAGRSVSVGGSVSAIRSAGSGSRASSNRGREAGAVRERAERRRREPPAPIAAPSVIPEASPSRVGRYSWPITTVMLKFAITTKPTPTSSSVAGQRPASRISDEQRAERGHRADHDHAPPEPVHEPPAEVGPRRARHQHHAQRPVAGRLARAELDREVDRMNACRPKNTAERSPTTDARRRNGPQASRSGESPALAPRPRSCAGANPQPPQLADQQPGGQPQRDQRQQRAVQPERQHRRRDEQRPEREARVAAEREHAHPAPALPAAHVVGVARPLGMERGDAEPAHGHRGDRRRVALRQPHRGQPHAPEREPGRHQPRQREPVRRDPEQAARARSRRSRRARAPPPRRRRAALGDQERQQRRHRACRKSAHRWPVASTASPRRSRRRRRHPAAPTWRTIASAVGGRAPRRPAAAVVGLHPQDRHAAARAAQVVAGRGDAREAQHCTRAATTSSSSHSSRRSVTTSSARALAQVAVGVTWRISSPGSSASSSSAPSARRPPRAATRRARAQARRRRPRARPHGGSPPARSRS